MIRLAVVGDPIAHSRSPEIHHAFAAQFGLAIDYQKSGQNDSKNRSRR